MTTLEETANEAELIRSARSLVQQFDAELVLAELLRRLDTSSSQLRGGLGHVATLLPPDKTAPALRAIAADRQNSPQARIAAALVLERFLGVDLPAGLMSDLDESNEVALQSLREAIAEAEHNRYILLEYVTQMREAESGVALMVMELLDQLPPEDQVEMLRIIAQDSRRSVTAHALQRLEHLGSAEGNTAAGVQAARALHILRFMLPPAFSAQVERSLRKLQFSGVRYDPPAPREWHALISPADVNGNQTVWFVHRPKPARAGGALLGFIINPVIGIVQMFGGEAMARAYLPAGPGLGQQMLLDIGEAQPLLMLEPPFDFARWLIQRALATYWRLADEPHDNLPALAPGPDALPHAELPLGGEFELYGDLLWQFAAPAPPAELRDYFHAPADEAGISDAHAGDADTASGRDIANLVDDLEQGAVDAARLAEMTTELLLQPAMVTWALQFRAMLEALGMRRLPHKGVADEDQLLALTERTLRRLGNLKEAPLIVAAMADALCAQAAWLHIAGDLDNAARAQTLATRIPDIPLQENPIIAALIVAGLHQGGRNG